MGEANGSFIYACKNLQRIQEALRYKRPGFAEYCNNKPGLSSSTAYRMLNVAKMFPDSGNISIQSREAIYLLAETSTPESARQEVLDRAATGEPFTYKKAKGILKIGGIPKTTIEPLIADTAPVGYGKDKSLRYDRKDSVRVKSQVNRYDDFNQDTEGNQNPPEVTHAIGTLEALGWTCIPPEAINEPTCAYCGKTFK